MPLILPLPMAVFQLLFLLVSIAATATAYQRRARMGPRRSVEYAAVIELAVVCIGWVAFFMGYGWLPSALQADVRQVILRGIWSPSLNTWLLVGAPLAFLLTFEMKSILAQVAGLVLHSPTPNEEDEDLPILPTGSGVALFRSKVTIFVNRYQKMQKAFEKEAIFMGHIASSAFGVLILAIQMLLFNLKG